MERCMSRIGRTQSFNMVKWISAIQGATTKTGPVVKKQDLSKLSATGLLGGTLSRNGWTQEQSRRLLALKLRDPSFEQFNVVSAWFGRQQDRRAPLEALWLNESLGKF